MLLETLEQKKCFKLVCGAGNEDLDEVEKLVYLYAKAGCNYFDLSANPKIVDAARQSLEKVGLNKKIYLGCSFGIKGDPHQSKAYINMSDCIKCGKCSPLCLQNAITEQEQSFNVTQPKCIGCGKCIGICPQKCISMQDKAKELKEFLPALIEKNIDILEFHAISEDDDEVFRKWNELNEMFSGPLSICIDRSKLGDEKLLTRVKKMLEIRKPYTTIIQADGFPMSGGKDDFKTTLQAVAAAEIFQNANLPAYLVISGGTNAKSTLLAKQCDINLNGIAIGSYARKIVKEFIEKEDFFENEKRFNEALAIAKNLVETSLKYMGQE